MRRNVRKVKIIKRVIGLPLEQVTTQNVLCFRQEVQEGRSPGPAVSWRQDVCPQATAVEESHG